jgi:hypothetical protein
MPINMDEWNKGRDNDTQYSKIEKFLSSNKGKAFSLNEIVEGIHGDIDAAGLIVYLPTTLIILDKLIGEGSIKSKIIQKEIGKEISYYTKT